MKARAKVVAITPSQKRGPGRPRLGKGLRVHKALRFDAWVLRKMKAVSKGYEQPLTQVVEQACVEFLASKGIRRAG